MKNNFLSICLILCILGGLVVTKLTGQQRRKVKKMMAKIDRYDEFHAIQRDNANKILINCVPLFPMNSQLSFIMASAIRFSGLRLRLPVSQKAKKRFFKRMERSGENLKLIDLKDVSGQGLKFRTPRGFIPIRSFEEYKRIGDLTGVQGLDKDPNRLNNSSRAAKVLCAGMATGAFSKTGTPLDKLINQQTPRNFIGAAKDLRAVCKWRDTSKLRRVARYILQG